jgi:hypothetical protein
MATFKLSLNVFVQGAPIQDALSHARRALQKIGMETRSRWADLIEQSPSIPREQKAYVQSLTVENTGPQVSVYSDWKYAYEIENGRPSRDLKRMLDTSMKVRVSTSKKNAGKRYLIIPFRHSTASMPGRCAPRRRCSRSRRWSAWARGSPERGPGTSRRRRRRWWPSESTGGATSCRPVWR